MGYKRLLNLKISISTQQLLPLRPSLTDILSQFALIFLMIICFQGPALAKELPPNSILGFGTQKIEQDNSDLVETAISKGYVMFDSAHLYRNIKTLAPILKKHQDKNLYVIYKVDPPKNLNDVKQLKQQIKEALETFGTIDCLMFHSVEDFYDSVMNTPAGEKIIKFIQGLIKSKSVGSFGISNVSLRYETIIEDFQKRELKVSLIENKFNNNLLHFLPTRDMVTYCKEHNIAFIAYGALGGIQEQGPCKALCDINFPVIQLSEKTHPNIFQLSNKYKIDPMMLMLAFESKEYGVYHIPTTTKKDRVVSNFDSFSLAFKVLQKEDLVLIKEDIALSTQNERASLPALYQDQEVAGFRSRVRLIQYLIESKDPMIETIKDFIDLISNKESDQKIFLQKILYTYEQSLKYGKQEELKEMLMTFNGLFSSDKARFKPILLETFNFDTNEASKTLVVKLLGILEIVNPYLGMLKDQHFTFQDESNAKNDFLIRKITVKVLDLDSKKIIKFDMHPPISVHQLHEKLKTFGITETFFHIAVPANSSLDLKLMEGDSIIANERESFGKERLPLDSGSTLLACGKGSNNKWARMLKDFDPESHSNMYK